ncbi:MAG: energy transducer TonB [Bacteroidota bacterium]
MDHALPHKKDENRKKGIIVTFMVHALLLLIALFPYLVSDQIPEEISGIVVAFGSPKGGNSNANPVSNTDELIAENTPKEDVSTDDNKKTVAASKEEEVNDPAPSKKPVSDIKPIAKTSDVAFEEAQKEKARKAAEAKEAEAKKRQADEIARQEAEREAEEKARKAAFSESKSKFSDLLGSGKGNNNNDGNVGDPKGDPNSEALNQIATGSGRIGGGLTDRGVEYEPEIDDNSQYTGVVVIKVCVDKSGKVIEANYTQLGSTTTSKTLVDLALDASKKYKFSPSEIEVQCGNITIEFKVR